MSRNPGTPDYTAAREGVAAADFGAFGWLRLTGRDRSDLLHRLSTNDMRGLAPGQGLPTVLTNPMGRIVALLNVHVGGETVWLRVSPGQAESIVAYLNSMIFWQDEVQVFDDSNRSTHFGLFGPLAGQTLTRLMDAPALPEHPYGWLETLVAGVRAMIQRCGPLDFANWMITVQREHAAGVWEALSEAGPTLSPETITALRVEAGIPAWGNELSNQVTPLEAGLAPAISYTKGCYTGQEVIARQTNYDKVTRRLVGLLLGAQPAVDLRGAAIRGAGGRAGFVGSVAWSPGLERHIALAIAPRDVAEPGTPITITHAGHEIAAQVVGLPFTEHLCNGG